MAAQIMMVTGATAGIGKQTALELAKQGATVILVARDRERGEATRAEVAAIAANSSVDLLLADFADPASIRAMADTFKSRYDHLNVLVNNAGVYMTQRRETADGLEMMFAVNHLGYFMTTLLLWDCLLAGGPARVVNVSSDAHRRGRIDFDDLQSARRFSGFGVYANTKLANLLFTYELDRRRGAADVTVNALHPGFVATNFGRNNSGVVGWAMSHLVPRFAKTAEEGAQTSIYLALSPAVSGASGRYFVDCKPVQSSAASQDRSAAARLWAVSEELTGVRLPALVNDRQ